jgi:hypothetical protein
LDLMEYFFSFMGESWNSMKFHFGISKVKLLKRRNFESRLKIK